MIKQNKINRNNKKITKQKKTIMNMTWKSEFKKKKNCFIYKKFYKFYSRINTD